MTRAMPTLESDRLRIRPFLKIDLDPIHTIKTNIGWVNPHLSRTQQRNEREQWLHWNILNHTQFGQLAQPPYGDKAVILKESGKLIGSVGLVPCLDAFEQLPYFGGRENCLHTTEMGLFWLIAPDEQGKGYATEAALTLIDYAFDALRLHQIVATTEYNNHASQAVMKKLGMIIERNPFPKPPWLQVVGVLAQEKLNKEQA